MKNKDLIIILLILFALGCNKPNPNPHLADFIYQDLQNQMAEAEKLRMAHETNANEFKSKIGIVDRQSREYGVLNKKFFAAKWEEEKMSQKITYLKLLILEREKHVRTEYLEAFSNGETWDNSNEIDNYKKSRAWDLKISRNSKDNK